MKKKDLDLENLIREIVKEDYGNVPESPLSKQETWGRIQQSIDKKQKKTHGSIIHKQIKKVSIACAIVLILYGSLFQSQSASAFNWVTDLFLNARGTITQLFGSAGESGPIEGDKPEPQIKVVGEDVKLETMSFENAQKVTRFPIVIPKKIPEGFFLRDVTVELKNDKKSDQIILNYTNGEESITIREIHIEKKLGYSMSIDNEDTKIQEIDINGKQGTLFIFKDGSKKMVWVREDIQIIINSLLTEEELIQIARSM
jgi:hypothetical protein